MQILYFIIPFLFVTAILFIMYLNGYFTIINTEIVSKDTYKINGDEYSYPYKKTDVVVKYTYKSGRVSFKTKTYYH